MREHGEDRLWLRLQRLLAAHPGWPVLHYGETEAIALKRMAERQNSEPPQGLVDLHQRVRQHWRLPVDSYGLKAVASWRGFRLSQPCRRSPLCVVVAPMAGTPPAPPTRSDPALQPRRLPATWAAQWLSNAAASGTESSSPASSD